jgi:hypothetical protein
LAAQFSANDIPMPVKARSDRVCSGVLFGPRNVTINFVVPILLAWLVTNYLHYRLYPTDVRDIAPIAAEYGAVRLKIKLPGTHEEIPEPLIVCGRPGNAALVYIRLINHSRARLGIEFWGIRADESETFPLPAMDAVIDITCYLPAFFPDENNLYWGTLSKGLRKIRRTQYYITVNGIVRLKGPVDYIQSPHSPIYLGSNPLGGSLVSSRFTGAILKNSQN